SHLRISLSLLELSFRTHVQELVTSFMAEKNIEFHIAANDYFGTLATTLDLLRQAIAERGCRAEDAELLRRLKEDLLFLQTNHTIQ
ncbi:MAG: hypothetical protein WA734_11505, partial [Candidatus Acidiferrales bacterium]